MFHAFGIIIRDFCGDAAPELLAAPRTVTANGKPSCRLCPTEPVCPFSIENLHERCFADIPCGKTEVIGAKPDLTVMPDMDMMQTRYKRGAKKRIYALIKEYCGIEMR